MLQPRTYPEMLGKALVWKPTRSSPWWMTTSRGPKVSSWSSSSGWRWDWPASSAAG
ncbi:MAG: hypothetical protein R3A10_04095 [Caldilineaceae bacterium]